MTGIKNDRHTLQALHSSKLEPDSASAAEITPGDEMSGAKQKKKRKKTSYPGHLI
jgi:hypothetical protein